MIKTALSIGLLALATGALLVPGANGQACAPVDPSGQVGIHEGKPSIDYVVLDCRMTPIHPRFNASEWTP